MRAEERKDALTHTRTHTQKKKTDDDAVRREWCCFEFSSCSIKKNVVVAI